jgi:hypothetical protein
MMVDLHAVLVSLSTQVEQMEDLRGIIAPFERARKITKKHATQRLSERKGAPPVDKKLAHLNTNTKYGGEEGIPVYRVEMFQF